MTTSSFHRTAPFWYYLPILPVAAFPWIVPALAGVGRARDLWRARREPAAREPLLLASWVIVPLLLDRKSTRLNSSHDQISYAVFCLKKKKKNSHSSTTAGSSARFTIMHICNWSY